MAKKILIRLITIYQIYISPIYKVIFGIKFACRYNLTCYDYSMQKIKKEGAIKGMWLTIKRIFSCNPYFKPIENI